MNSGLTVGGAFCFIAADTLTTANAPGYNCHFGFIALNLLCENRSKQKQTRISVLLIYKFFFHNLNINGTCKSCNLLLKIIL